jgi:hypothetical protein
MTKFIGHTRFSVFSPSSGQWRATQGRFSTPEEYRRYLYSDERLESRAWIFLELSLANLARWDGDHELMHIVSYSSSLPERWVGRLEEAAARYDFLVLDRLEESATIDLIESYAVERAEAEGMQIASGEAVGSSASTTTTSCAAASWIGWADTSHRRTRGCLSRWGLESRRSSRETRSTSPDRARTDILGGLDQCLRQDCDRR